MDDYGRKLLEKGKKVLVEWEASNGNTIHFLAWKDKGYFIADYDIQTKIVSNDEYFEHYHEFEDHYCDIEGWCIDTHELITSDVRTHK